MKCRAIESAEEQEEEEDFEDIFVCVMKARIFWRKNVSLKFRGLSFVLSFCKSMLYNSTWIQLRRGFLHART